MKHRRILWLTASIAAAAIWSVGIEPRWVAHREIAHTVADWKGPAGLKVVVASDWHLTDRRFWRVMTAERAGQIIDDINAAQPDVILLPGDLVADGHLGAAESGISADQIAAVLGRLKARLGVYAALGNHDWWFDGPRMADALQKQGIHVLENEATPLPGTPLWVVGIGDSRSGHAQPVRAVAKLPPGAQSLVFMHDPAAMLQLPPTLGLLAAGHTHGGQVSIPFFGALYVSSTAPRSWGYGWVEHGANRMYVTSGLGVSILPIRFNMRPEWVMFTINGAGR